MGIVKSIQATEAYQDNGYLGVVLLALTIVLVTMLVSVMLIRIMRRALKHATDGEVGGSILVNISRGAIWVFGLSLILKYCLNFEPTVIWGALGVGGIAISLGMQSTISNLIGGLQLSLSRDVSVDKWVIIGTGVPAKVIDINWRVTKLRDEFGNKYIVPNQVLNSTAVTVLTEPYSLYLDLSLATDADMETITPKVISIAYEALKESGMLYEDRMPVLSVTGSTVDSISTRLKVFAHRDFTQIEINNAVMPPILSYLQSINALAHCYSGQ